VGEISEMTLPLAWTRPQALAGDVEIGLDEHGEGRGRGRRGLEEQAGRCSESEDDARDAADALVSAARQQQSASNERVDSYEQETDAIDAGEGSELIDERVVHLRITKLVPGNRRDARGRELKRSPEDGSRGEGDCNAAGCATHQSHHEPKEREVKAEHETETDEQQRGRKGRHVAVLAHDVANPVAVAGVPQYATDIREQKGAAQRARLIRAGG